ncbi:MAG: glycosyltransferase family protein [Planctomycetota bacterium]|nr:glycosyltransferase family protein [Planctomycetota bacterium]
MRTVAIIQARLGSSRLPGKVLMDIAGRPMLERVVERARRAITLDEVVVATTTEPADEQIVALAADRGWRAYRGSQEDVLDRYVQVARAVAADVVVRITSDCPLIDPGVIDQVVRGRAEGGADYCSNGLGRRTFPRGLDVEALTREALERADREATRAHEREHVTPYLYERAGRFVLRGVESPDDHSHHRWTVDTPEDLALVRGVYEGLGSDGPASWREVLEVLQRRPELVTLNAHVRQKPVAATDPSAGER